MTTTTKQLAKALHITPLKLRRILRSIARFNDKRYTRYRLNKTDVKQIENKVVSISKKPAKKAA